MNFSALLVKMFIFFVLIIIGYLAARNGMISEEFSKSASALLVNVFIFASIVNSVLGERPELSNTEAMKALGILTVMILLLYLGGFAFAWFFRKQDDAPQTELLVSSVNNLFVGLPVAQALFGTEAVFYCGLSCVPYNIFLYTYGVWRLRKNGGKGSLKDILTPCLIASLLALVIFLFNIQVPGVIKELLSSVSGATVPLSMIVIGATLGKISLLDAFREKRIYALSLMRLVIVPVAVYFIMRLITDNTVLLVTVTVLAATPSAMIITPLSIRYGYNPEYSSKTIMVTTLLSMITMPALVYILFM